MASIFTNPKYAMKVMLAVVLITVVAAAVMSLIFTALQQEKVVEREPLTAIQTEAYEEAMRANLDTALGQAGDTVTRASGADVETEELLAVIDECTAELTTGDGPSMHGCLDRLAVATGVVQAALNIPATIS